MRSIITKSISLGIVIFLIAGMAVFSACQPSGSQAQASPSEKLYKAKCRSCHVLPKPSSKTGNEWTQIIDSHSKRIKLTNEQTDLILKHLTTPPEIPTDK